MSLVPVVYIATGKSAIGGVYQDVLFTTYLGTPMFHRMAACLSETHITKYVFSSVATTKVFLLLQEDRSLENEDSFCTGDRKSVV